MNKYNTIRSAVLITAPVKFMKILKRFPNQKKTQKKNKLWSVFFLVFLQNVIYNLLPALRAHMLYTIPTPKAFQEWKTFENILEWKTFFLT